MASEGQKTSEHKFAWVGVIIACLAAILPILLKALPPDSIATVILGSLAAIVAVLGGYFGVRGFTKVGVARAKAVEEAAKLDP